MEGGGFRDDSLEADSEWGFWPIPCSWGYFGETWETELGTPPWPRNSDVELLVDSVFSFFFRGGTQLGNGLSCNCVAGLDWIWGRALRTGLLFHVRWTSRYDFGTRTRLYSGRRRRGGISRKGRVGYGGHEGDVLSGWLRDVFVEMEHFHREGGRGRALLVTSSSRCRLLQGWMRRAWLIAYSLFLEL